MDIEQDEFTHMGMILDRVLAVNPGINGGVRSVPPSPFSTFPEQQKMAWQPHPTREAD